MKYIKKFKNIIVGDYVVMNCNIYLQDKEFIYPGFIDFVNNSVGKLVVKNIKNDILTVEYENIPKDTINAFRNNIYNKKIKHWLHFSLNDVVFNSTNKEEAEVFLTSIKYNL